MNSSSEEDKLLTEFLKQHQPVAPPASVNLEDRIMREIETNISPEEFVRRDRSQSSGSTQQHQVWLIPSAIAAGVIATVIGYRTFAPAPQPSPAEVAGLEAFIESSWSNTVASELVVDHTYEQILSVEDPSAVN
jgi:hypothetical protein